MRGERCRLTGHELKAEVFSKSTTVRSPEGELSHSFHGAYSPLRGQCVLDFQFWFLRIHRLDGYSGITARQRINAELTFQVGNYW